MKKIILFGASGRIGSAFRKKTVFDVKAVSSDELRYASETQILSRALDLESDYDFVFSGGATDPALGREFIFESNVHSVIRVIEAAKGLQPHSATYRFLTLGTVHEKFPALSQTNPYLESKVALAKWMGGQAQAQKFFFLHLRLQTVFGGKPADHMFLGQILHALKLNHTFGMSSGDQLREYHHVDEVAEALESLLKREWDFGPHLDLSSGEAVRLADLARYIFRAFGKDELLKVGAIPSRQEENRTQTFTRSPEWLVPHFREPLDAIRKYLAEHLG